MAGFARAMGDVSLGRLTDPVGQKVCERRTAGQGSSESLISFQCLR